MEDIRVSLFKNGEGLDNENFVDFEGNQLPDSYLKIHEVNRSDIYRKFYISVAEIEIEILQH